MGVAVTVAATLNVALNFWLIPRYGKDGAALATLLAFAIIPVYFFYRSQLVYRIPYRFGSCLVIILFAAAMIQIGGGLSFESTWRAIVTKLGLLLLFLPLPLVIRIVTFSDVRRAYIYSIGKLQSGRVPSHAGNPH